MNMQLALKAFGTLRYTTKLEIRFVLWFLEMLKEPTQTEQEIDAAALKQLCDMGFPQNRAKKALLLNE